MECHSRNRQQWYVPAQVYVQKLVLAMRGGACARECVSELHCARWTRRWSTTAREIDTLGERGLDTIRGLRVCQNEECRLHMNRDKTSAPLIGIQCKRLLRGDPPIASMTPEEAELTLHNQTMQCEECL